MSRGEHKLYPSKGSSKVTTHKMLGLILLLYGMYGIQAHNGLDTFFASIMF